METLSDSATKSYRYLRLGIVVVVLALGASVLIERSHATCWQQSISAYYYTPTHAMFVGALVAIGVSLIAVKGSTEWEDMLMNVAGMLAPIVAFVPTTPPNPYCSTTAALGPYPESYVRNNVLALAIGGGVALIAALVLSLVSGRVDVTKIADVTKSGSSRLGILLTAVLVAAGLVWYFGYRDSFIAHAHSYTAAAMFAMIAVLVLLNAIRAHGTYRLIYIATVTFMVVAAGVIFVVKLASPDWAHQVLWAETLEILPFAVFWAAQTAEHWTEGVKRATVPSVEGPPGCLETLDGV